MKTAIAYNRVSTAQQGKSGLGLEAQQAALVRFAEAEGFDLVQTFQEVETGKGADALNRRPQLAAALKAAKKMKSPTTKAATRSASRKSSKFKSRKRPAPASSKPAARPATKNARIIAMLRTPTGATIASIVTATEWQQHSVRGFLAGVVRKKLGLNLVSEQTDKGRVYRIKDGKTSPAAPDRAKQAA